MESQNSATLGKAIETISQSDPLIKLLHEVKLGRMKPTDPGIRVITETWFSTYQSVLAADQGLDRKALIRLDPGPRIAVLVKAGVVTEDHSGAVHLRQTFQDAFQKASG